MIAKDVIKSFLAELDPSKDQFERREILEFAEQQNANIRETIFWLKENAGPSVILKSPIIYDRSTLDKIIQEMEAGPVVSNAQYSTPELAEETEQENKTRVENKVLDATLNAALDPNLKNMIKTRSYRDLEELINPDMPINIFINGETGLGKSTATMHIHRKLHKALVRVNISNATDVDDLIGGLRLKDGNSPFDYGPVIRAMKSGATLLLDELPQGSHRVLMELQPILEGKGYLIKKTNEMVYPEPGFCVIATGNSKGVGDATGKYVGETIMNGAFRDRFAVYLTFEPPTRKEMEAILKADVPLLSENCIDTLAAWYEQIRKSVESDVAVEAISTRRMVDIAKLFVALRAKNPEDEQALKAIKYGCNIFDDEVANAFHELWGNMVQENVKDREQNEQNARLASQMPGGKHLDEDGNKIPF